MKSGNDLDGLILKISVEVSSSSDHLITKNNFFGLLLRMRLFDITCA